MRDIEIYEVGPRDGLQNSKFSLDTSEKVKMIKLPVQSKNPLLILINGIALIAIILIYNIQIVQFNV